jgi:hypothetical protein
VRAAAIAGVMLAGLGYAAGAAAAEEQQDSQFRIGVSAGTLGISPEIGWRSKHVGVRANGGFFEYDRNENIDDIDYDGTLKLNSFGGLVDIYPFGGSFRLSVGARSNSNKVDLLATPTAPVEIGDVTYSPAQIGNLSGHVEFKKFSPTASIGWGGKLRDGFTIGFELGVISQGSPKIDLVSSGGTLSNNATFLAELEQERLQAEDDASDFKFWPIVQLHLMYRF